MGKNILYIRKQYFETMSNCFETLLSSLTSKGSTNTAEAIRCLEMIRKGFDVNLAVQESERIEKGLLLSNGGTHVNTIEETGN